MKILYTLATIDGTATGKLKIKINTKAHFNVAPLKLPISAIKLCFDSDARGRFYLNELSILLNKANIKVHLASKKDWNGEI